MSEGLAYYRRSTELCCVSLPGDSHAFIEQWSALRPVMTRDVPEAFTRDEWAYLIAFLDRGNLERPFTECFGDKAAKDDGSVSRLYRPRGPVALWLPNNVSLLGPLTLILVSLTGQPLRIKAGSRSGNLTGEFLDFALSRLPDCALRRYLHSHVSCKAFDRHHAENAAMAEDAQVRIVFGSDEAARHIHALAHPDDSVGFSFLDRRSEVWIEDAAVTPDLLTRLIKVFAIYGQAGCTSPRRVALLGADHQSAVSFRDRLLELWSGTIADSPPMIVASENSMARQWAAAEGWDARIAGSNAAVIAVGKTALPEVESNMFLAITPASFEEAEATLPANIQTLAYASRDPGHVRWLELVARNRIKRLVRIDEMHHFGAVWDGTEFWRQLFEAVEISS